MAYSIIGKDGKVAKSDDGTEIKATDLDISPDDIVLKAENGKRIIDVAVSSDRQDRDGDRVIQEGIDPKHAKTVLYAHDWGFGGTMPLGKIVKRRIEKKQDFKVTIESHEFPPEGKHLLSDTAWNLIEFGALRSTSIGFIPRKTTYANSDEEREKMNLGQHGVLFDKVEQLETSWVPVQSNRDAITEALGKGLIPQEVLKEMFPECWLKEIEPPKHWFVDINISDDEGTEVPETVNLKDAIDLLAGIAKKLDVLITKNLDTGAQQAGAGSRPEEIDLSGLADAIDEMLIKRPDIDEADIIAALESSLDGKLKAGIAGAAASVVDDALGRVNPDKLKFKKRTG